MIKGMSHVGISVFSLDRAIEFYHGLLGMEIKVRDTFGEEGHLEEYEKYKAVLGLRDPEGKWSCSATKTCARLLQRVIRHPPSAAPAHPNA